MNIRLHNDGKENDQSFEVHIDCGDREPDFRFDFEVSAYGPTAEAAQANAIKALDRLRAKIAEAPSHRLLKL